MRSAPRWRSWIPTIRQIRYTILQGLDRLLPKSICRVISLSTQQGEFSSMAAISTLTVTESSDSPFPAEWMNRFLSAFEVENRLSGRVASTSELQIRLASFENALILGHSGQIIDAQTNLSISPVGRGLSIPGFLRTAYLDGAAFSLITGRPGSHKNYYHFLTEQIPEYLEALGIAVSEFGSLTLLLPDTHHPLEAKLSSEARRRYPTLPVRYVQVSEKVLCKTVVSFHVQRSSNWRSPANRKLLRHTTETMGLSRFTSQNDRPFRRLFVSRCDAKRRRLLNESEVLLELSQLGFEHVTPGCLSFKDQVAVFSQAQIVAGPHGAGLTNLIFMPKGGATIEIFSSGQGSGYYAWLSHLSGHTYRHVHSDNHTPQGDFRLSGPALDSLVRSVTHLANIR